MIVMIEMMMTDSAIIQFRADTNLLILIIFNQLAAFSNTVQILVLLFPECSKSLVVHFCVEELFSIIIINFLRL